MCSGAFVRRVQVPRELATHERGDAGPQAWSDTVRYDGQNDPLSDGQAPATHDRARARTQANHAGSPKKMIREVVVEGDGRGRVPPASRTRP